MGTGYAYAESAKASTMAIGGGLARQSDRNKGKKMGWIKRKIISWLKEEQTLSADDYAPQMVSNTISKSNRIESERHNRMSFNVYKASGGHVVEFSSYDHVRDHHTHNLHIINDDEDFAESLGKIVFMESLRK